MLGRLLLLSCLFSPFVAFRIFAPEHERTVYGSANERGDAANGSYTGHPWLPRPAYSVCGRKREPSGARRAGQARCHAGMRLVRIVGICSGATEANWRQRRRRYWRLSRPTNSANHEYEDHGQHHRIFGDVLALVGSPQSKEDVAHRESSFHRKFDFVMPKRQAASF